MITPSPAIPISIKNQISLPKQNTHIFPTGNFSLGKIITNLAFNRNQKMTIYARFVTKNGQKSFPTGEKVNSHILSPKNSSISTSELLGGSIE